MSAKLRILCLHGYHGTADVLREQMTPLFSPGDDLEALADFVRIDAPSHQDGDFGWWHAVNAERDPAGDDPGVDGPHRHYKGWARTREGILATFAERGPFDGVFGFSQGAALAGLLCGLRSPAGRLTAERPLAFDFAIMVSGFPSNDPELAKLYANRDGYDLPALHIIGNVDGIVSPATTRALAAHFTKPTLVEHAGGHVIPGDRAVRNRVRDFLQNQSKRR